MKRLSDESFEDYKKRRLEANKAVKRILRGNLIWANGCGPIITEWLDEYKKEQDNDKNHNSPVNSSR